MLEVTVDDSQGAVISDVVLKVLTLECLTTLVSTWHWITATHRPVVGGYFFIARVKLFAVLTAERSSRTLVVLVFFNARAKEEL